MKAYKVLGIAAAILGAAFVVQVGVRYYDKPAGPVYMASWRFTPKSMAEAVGLSKTVVEGRVAKVRKAPDIVVSAPGEPGGVDRIPQEVVTFTVEKVHKGTSPKTVEVYRTGSSVGVPPAGRAAPTEAPPPRPAQLQKGAIPRPETIPAAPATAATILLEDAPDYKVGDRYLLLLTDGPTLTVEGAAVKTQTVISPEGRYRIGANNMIEPVSKKVFADKEFAAQLRGKTLSVLEMGLQKHPGILKTPLKLGP